MAKEEQMTIFQKSSIFMHIGIFLGRKQHQGRLYCFYFSTL